MDPQPLERLADSLLQAVAQFPDPIYQGGPVVRLMVAYVRHLVLVGTWAENGCNKSVSFHD